MSAGTKMKGTIITNNGAVYVSTRAFIEGRVLTSNNTVTTFAATVNMTTGCQLLSTVNLRSVHEQMVVYPNPFNTTLTIQAIES
jgi:hypothetical protein